MASVSVEGRGSLVNVEGFSDLSREPIILLHQDLGVIQCVAMTSGHVTSHSTIVKDRMIWLKCLGMFHLCF